MQFVKMERRLGYPNSMIVRIEKDELEFIADLAHTDASAIEYQTLIAMFEPEDDDADSMSV